MKISIIAPVYNEEEGIEKILNDLLSIKFSSLEKEIIVVDDGSIDFTSKILKKFNGIKIIAHSENLGKGSAIRTGIKNSTGDIIAIQDGDLEYDPKDLPRLVEPIINGNEKVVFGSRFLGEIRKMSFSHSIGNVFLTFITRFLYRYPITDVETCFKIFKKSVLKNIKLEAKGFEIEPELTGKILKNGYKIHEMPITYTARTKNDKNINWKDGIVALVWLIKIKFTGS